MNNTLFLNITIEKIMQLLMDVYQDVIQDYAVEFSLKQHLCFTFHNNRNKDRILSQIRRISSKDIYHQNSY